MLQKRNKDQISAIRIREELIWLLHLILNSNNIAKVMEYNKS